MQYLWFLVKNPADAVTTVLADHRVVVLLRVLLDHSANITQGGSGFDDLQRHVETFLGNLDKALGVWCHVANLHHDAGVAVETIFYYGHIYVDDIAVLELAGIRRDAVTNHVVNGGAYGAGEAVVVERSRNRLLGFGDIVVTDSVQLSCRDAHLHQRLDHFQHLRCKAPCNPHLFHLSCGLDRYCHL